MVMVQGSDSAVEYSEKCRTVVRRNAFHLFVKMPTEELIFIKIL